jgi:hypothetical protein
MSVPELPKLFFSYVHYVDEHDNGMLSWLRNRLEGELRVQTGFTIEVFQDVRDINWGDDWRARIAAATAGSLFLIPVVTPGYFLSKACKEEYDAFKAVQINPGAEGVILPIHYVDTPELLDSASRAGNPWAEDLARNQWVDWRRLRLYKRESRSVAKQVTEMARQIVRRLRRLDVLPQQLPSAPLRLRFGTRVFAWVLMLLAGSLITYVAARPSKRSPPPIPPVGPVKLAAPPLVRPEKPTIHFNVAGSADDLENLRLDVGKSRGRVERERNRARLEVPDGETFRLSTPGCRRREIVADPKLEGGTIDLRKEACEK